MSSAAHSSGQPGLVFGAARCFDGDVNHYQYYLGYNEGDETGCATDAEDDHAELTAAFDCAADGSAGGVLSRVEVFNRLSGCCMWRIQDFQLFVVGRDQRIERTYNFDQVTNYYAIGEWALRQEASRAHRAAARAAPVAGATAARGVPRMPSRTSLASLVAEVPADAAAMHICMRGQRSIVPRCSPLP